MHLHYLCAVINWIGTKKRGIASIWIGIICLSLGLISFHTHEHTSHDCAHHGHAHAEDQAHSHSADHSHEDCTYCFLFYHQQVDQLFQWNWENKAVEWPIEKFSPSLYHEGIVSRQSIPYSLRGPPSYFLAV